MPAVNIKIALPSCVRSKSYISKITEEKGTHCKVVSATPVSCAFGSQRCRLATGISGGTEQGQQAPITAGFQRLDVSAYPITDCFTPTPSFFFFLVNLLPTSPDEKSNALNSSSPKEERNQFPIFLGKNYFLQFLSLSLLYGLLFHFNQSSDTSEAKEWAFIFAKGFDKQRKSKQRNILPLTDLSYISGSGRLTTSCSL